MTPTLPPLALKCFLLAAPAPKSVTVAQRTHLLSSHLSPPRSSALTSPPRATAIDRGGCDGPLPRARGMYLHADEDGAGVSLSPRRDSLNAAWLVHLVQVGGMGFVLLCGAAYGR
ncbi:hypothetical protein HU200_035670 [Digitaria exilis]|uniref:Uncharacterized protein n=1 Tax=Digitaria exilis TaxID=1010633 RepID=A0A835BHX7_9POAL|nr:hypothetical protein HU200_035670 [Digitaria exilis]